MIFFITSNQGKFKNAQKALEKYGIQIEQKEIDVLEIQSPKIEEITRNKAEQAYKQIKKSLLITDAGYNIPALNGFPGSYMHDINNWLTNKDFLKLMEDKRDKTIYLEYVAVYQDKNIQKSFKAHFHGNFTISERGTKGSNFDRITSFRKDGKTSAQCEDEGINFHDLSEHPLWKEVGEWLRENKV